MSDEASVTTDTIEARARCPAFTRGLSSGGGAGSRADPV